MERSFFSILWTRSKSCSVSYHAPGRRPRVAYRKQLLEKRSPHRVRESGGRFWGSPIFFPSFQERITMTMS